MIILPSWASHSLYLSVRGGLHMASLLQSYNDPTVHLEVPSLPWRECFCTQVENLSFPEGQMCRRLCITWGAGYRSLPGTIKSRAAWQLVKHISCPCCHLPLGCSFTTWLIEDRLSAYALNQNCKINSMCSHYITNEHNILPNRKHCTKFFECRANSL